MHESQTAVHAAGDDITPMLKKKLTLLSNHGRILVCIAEHRESTIQWMANKAGLSNRAVQTIVDDLAREGYLERTRDGRRNVYQVNVERAISDDCERSHTVGAMLLALGADKAAAKRLS